MARAPTRARARVYFQADAQGSVRLGKGLTFVAYVLNLNNEVFGFYQGSPKYMIQREYYQPAYAGASLVANEREINSARNGAAPACHNARTDLTEGVVSRGVLPLSFVGKN